MVMPEVGINRSLLRSREEQVYPLPLFDKQQRRLCSRYISRHRIHHILLEIVAFQTSCLLNRLGEDRLKLEILRITLEVHQ